MNFKNSWNNLKISLKRNKKGLIRDFVILIVLFYLWPFYVACSLAIVVIGVIRIGSPNWR